MGLVAVLYQKDESGQVRVIAYASRSLSKSEKNYAVHRLEFLALKWAITEKFTNYLYGGTFEVFTDNNPLTYILTSAKLDATTQRWIDCFYSYFRTSWNIEAFSLCVLLLPNLRVVPHGMKGTGPRHVTRPVYLRSQFRNNSNTVLL